MDLRKGRHTVAVSAKYKTQGVRGQLVDAWRDPVELSVNVQPLSSTEVESFGLQVNTAYRVKYWAQANGGVPWPGGPYSRITWNGREFDQQGEAMLSSMSPRTGHVRVIMTVRSVEAA